MLPSYQDALAKILAAARPLPPVAVSPLEAAELVLAADLVAVAASPAFDNSAMDGFAIRAQDTDGASAGRPARLAVRSTIAAGEEGMPAPIGPGEAAEIMTGAPVPQGATSVIPVEMTRREGDHVLIQAPYPEGRNIRRAGSDFAPGAVLARAGTRIGAAAMPVLAAAGVAQVRVYPRPRLFWISTGRELVDTPGAALRPGAIYNSSGPFGSAAAPLAGAEVVQRATVEDDGESFRRALDAALADARVDLVISTGAVSVGKYDFVRAVLEEIGAEILLHRVKVKPGKPILFARLPDGRFFFGLPGNPVSTAMGFRMFVTPFLRALAGLGPERPVFAILKEDAAAARELTVFLKGRVEILPSCMAAATVLAGQESYKIGAMAEMNAWIAHPEGVETLAAGTPVACYPVAPDAWPAGEGLTGEELAV